MIYPAIATRREFLGRGLGIVGIGSFLPTYMIRAALAGPPAAGNERIVVALLLTGGPDGLSPAGVARANERWSLSNLTLPHGLVRVVVAEALYRAWSVLENHPYHRA